MAWSSEVLMGEAVDSVLGSVVDRSNFGDLYLGVWSVGKKMALGSLKVFRIVWEGAEFVLEPSEGQWRFRLFLEASSGYFCRRKMKISVSHV
jgi:hypothetical protein